MQLMLWFEFVSAGCKFTHCFAQALSEALSHKVMREARAQQDEVDAEDQPEGAIGQVLQHGIAKVPVTAAYWILPSSSHHV